VFGGILFRMILWELTKVFLMSLVGITGIMLMAGIIAETAQLGLGPTQILAAIPLLIPSTLPYTIPATTLFATCVVYGRLAADNEILAIKSAGISARKVVVPGLLLGLAMSGSTLALSFDLIPYSHRLLVAMAFADAKSLLYTMLRKEGMISHPSFPYAMYVKGVRGEKLLWPVFKHKGAHGQIDYVAHACEAELEVHMAKRELSIHMRNGVMVGEDGARAYFEDKVWTVELPGDFGKGSRPRPRDMLWEELGQRRQELAEERTGLLASVPAPQIPGRPPPAELLGLQSAVNTKLAACDSQIRTIDAERQIRPALSVGCLCFILVGCPVGIFFSRSDYLSSFITCFLPIVFIYYPTMLCSAGMAKSGQLPIIPMVWSADALVGLTGLLLSWRLLRN
jgi:lipopolysaccharide export system permease protein